MGPEYSCRGLEARTSLFNRCLDYQGFRINYLKEPADEIRKRKCRQCLASLQVTLFFSPVATLNPSKLCIRARACAHTANSIFIYKSMLWKDISTSKSLEYSPTGSAWNVHIYTWSNLGSDVHKGPCSHWPRRP